MATPGVCLYCKVTEEQVDGNKLSWHDATRTCCSKYSCVKQHHAAAKRAASKPKSRFAELLRKGYGPGGARMQIDAEKRAARRRLRRKDRAA